MTVARKAVLLAAGLGTRLGPLAAHTPKCLLPVAGEPLLGHWLKRLRGAGVEEVLVNTHAHADQVQAYLRGWRQPSVRCAYEPVLLGSAGTLAAHRGWLDAADAFWVLYADVLCAPDLEAMAAGAPPLALASLGLFTTDEPERCGIATLDGQGWITAFEEKPRQPRSRLAFAGVLLGRRALLEELPRHTPADIGLDLLPRLVGRMTGYRLPGMVLDIGAPERYALAQQVWSSKAANPDLARPGE
ncbi:MAG: nucleotidyltransferase family protein [Terriglobales bacterium]